MAKQLLGRVAMDFKGEFNSSSTYEKLDVVVYEGCSYCALKETKGNLPTNEEFFVLLVRKPISGIDYFTEDEKEEFVSRITDDANSLFNQNVESKAREFNTNHQDKVNDFNNNYDTKLSSFDSNYDSKVKSFNNNANNQTTTFNENVTEKQKEFDNNVTDQTETFNTNATNKINEYNTNANNKVEEFNANAVEKTNEFNSTANVQKITSLSNEFYRVKDEVLETGEASDTFIHLEDSSMSELQELEIEGVCQQETTSGSNLCNLNVVQDSRVTINSDGTITINGSGGFSLKYSSYEFKANTNYYVKWELISGQTTGRQIFFAPNGKVWTEKDKFVNFNYDSDTTGSGIWVHTDATFTNAVIKIWFSETQSDFEPYTGENPSPSPDYPKKIKTITGELNLTNCGKNLLKGITYNNTHNGINYVFNDNSVLAKGTSTSQSISIYSVAAIENGFLSTLDKGKYVLKISSPNAMAELVNELGNRIVKTFSNNPVAKFELKQPTKYFYRIVVSENTTVDETFYLQLEKGEEGTAFEEYISSQITANIPDGEFIGKLDDTYKDTLNIEYNEDDGEYHLILNKVIGEDIYTGEDTENWAKNIYRSGVYQIANKNVAKLPSDNMLGNIIANYFTTNTPNRVWNSNIDGITNLNDLNMIRLRFKDDTIQTVENLRDWLKSHNLKIFYLLANPYSIDLGSVEMPLSYNEVTNIFTDSDLLPKINAKYYRNFKKTVQNLQVNNDTLKNELISIENRLTALENANTSTVDVDESEVTE